MFDNLLGDFEGHQKKVLEQLKNMVVEVRHQGVFISGDGNRNVKGIEIDQDLMTNDKEMLEDILIAAFNKFVEKADEEGGKASESMMKDMLPPGFEDIFNSKD